MISVAMAMLPAPSAYWVQQARREGRVWCVACNWGNVESPIMQATGLATGLENKCVTLSVYSRSMTLVWVLKCQNLLIESFPPANSFKVKWITTLPLQLCIRGKEDTAFYHHLLPHILILLFLMQFHLCLIHNLIAIPKGCFILCVDVRFPIS